MSGAPRPRHGFLLGKFMPPHNGHLYLCDFARHHCASLTILVCSLADDPIPGALRHRWMSEMFPDCRVLWCEEPLPQEPADDPDFWAIWRDVVVRYGGGLAPDAVYASEAYGHRLAEEVGALFVPVDAARSVAAVSATAVRSAPLLNWRHIPPLVRPWFVRRVCLFGAESTGKTSLAEALARRFETVVAPEYGRTYTQAFGTCVGADDLLAIVAGHRAGVAAAARQANRILIEDTDPLLTGVWSEMLLGERLPALEESDEPADFYLLTSADFAWVDDGTRYFPDPERRSRFDALCEQALAERRLPYLRLSGSHEQRLALAVAALRQRYGID